MELRVGDEKKHTCFAYIVKSKTGPKRENRSYNQIKMCMCMEFFWMKLAPLSVWLYLLFWGMGYPFFFFPMLLGTSLSFHLDSSVSYWSLKFSYWEHQLNYGGEHEGRHRLWKSNIRKAEVSCPWSDWADWGIRFIEFRSMNPSYSETEGPVLTPDFGKSDVI